MEKTKAFTQREEFNYIMEVCKDNERIVNFCQGRIEMLDKKSVSSKGGTSKTQVENQAICEVLLAELEKVGKAVTISELMATSEVIRNYTLENGNPLTNQKISALFKLMGEDGTKQVVKVVDKKKSYFSVA